MKEVKRATMGDMGGQIDKMVSFIQFEAKNKKEEILAKAKQDKEAKKLEAIHREKLKIDADFNKRIKNVDVQNKMYAFAICWDTITGLTLGSITPEMIYWVGGGGGSRASGGRTRKVDEQGEKPQPRGHPAPACY